MNALRLWIIMLILLEGAVMPFITKELHVYLIFSTLIYASLKIDEQTA